jgi:serine/threonine protein kinase
MSDPLIGQHLASYQIEHLIGRGGMASVYYGWDSRLQRPVAVKVADASRDDIAYARRLVHEARMMARWRHDHVIQVYYADQQGSLYFFAMDYVDGLDLGQLMARYAAIGQLIPHPDVVRIGRAVASGLDYAHARQVIHRDVKPTNVLLALDGRIVLSDFGLALDVQQGTLGEVLGTPGYVAPEQARDSASTVPESDLYALGVILYELLTGSLPFDDPSPMSLALKHIAEPPPLPTDLNPALSIPVEAVLLKALSKAAADRYRSGEALMDALERALALPPMMPVEGGDPRLILPVADVLADLAASRSTHPAHPSVGGEPVTSPVRYARQKIARRQRGMWLVLGGIAAVVILAGLAALLSPQVSFDARGTPPQGAPSAEPTSEASAAPEATVLGVDQASPTLQAPTPLNTERPVSPPQPGLAPTVLYPNGYTVRLLYTERGFYLFNGGDLPVEVGHLAFEALDTATGAPAKFGFTTKTWTGRFLVVETGKCDAIEIFRTSADALRPKECDGSNFNALTTPEAASSELFWLARDNVTQFRVLWDGQEFARCAAGSGSCDIYTP